MQNLIQIKDGALFIADAHFLPEDKSAFNLFNKLIKNPPSQLFLMGDIFHLLIAHIPSSLKAHKSLLALLDTLSEKCEIFYFEGNHDFALPNLPKIKIYPRALQPAIFKILDSKVLLAHGDLYLQKDYEIYIYLMNTPLMLSLFKLLDILTFGKLYTKIAQKVATKPIKRLKNVPNFEDTRKALYAKNQNLESISAIIEGHFHATPGKNLQIPSNPSPLYLAIPSYHCDKKGLQCVFKASYVEISTPFLG